MKPSICFIKEDYYLDHPDLQKILDPEDIEKASRRSYLYLRIDDGGLDFYIPLRTNLGKDVRPFGRIGHTLATQNRPNAGLDYRHTLLICSDDYIEKPTSPKISRAQLNQLTLELPKIKNEFLTYLRRYKKVAKKNRINKEPLFCDCSLINFHSELNI